MALPGQLADPNYRYSINEYTADGAQITWEISFAGGYISRSHVKSLVISPSGASSNPAFTWSGDNAVVITPPVSAGHTLYLYRETPKAAPYADFVDGAVINELNLDGNAKQAVFIAAETADYTSAALAEAATAARQSADFAAVAIAAVGGSDISGAVSQFDARILTKTNASAIGVSGNDTHMGIFSGSVIPDNPTAKQALQALETRLEETSSTAPSKGAALIGKAGSGTVQDTISLLEGISASPQISSLFTGDGSTARHGAVLNLAGASASQNEIGFSVTVDNAVLVGGGKSYSVGLFAAQTSRAGSCTGYGLNTIFRSYGPPGTSIEANTDNFGPDSGNLVTQNSVFGAYAWVTGINILIAGTGNVLAGLVIGSPPAYVKKINRGILIDGDCIRLNGIEDTSNAPTAYMMRGAKGVGIDTSNATFSTNRAMLMAAGHFFSWSIGGTVQDVLGVSGSDLQIGYGVSRTLFGSSLVPGADNAMGVGNDSARVSRLTAVELKSSLDIFVATTPPSAPPAGHCYLYMDNITGVATVKDSSGVAHPLW